MFENNYSNVTSIDQASSLRKLNETDNISVIAITGGKGGVGKTSISINLSIALAKLKNNVMLLDADFGLSNIDVMLGLSAWKNLQHVLSGECDLEDVVIEGPHAVKIIPSASGAREMASLSSGEYQGIMDSISQLAYPIDYFLIDTAAGIGNGVFLFSQMANDIIVVLCDEPASIADAYALVKVLNKYDQDKKFRIITNMVESSTHADYLFAQFYKICTHFLDVTLEHSGYIPEDNYLKKAIKKQKSVFDMFPSSRSALAMKRIAKDIDEWPKQTNTSGAVELFLERQLSSKKNTKV